MIHLQSLSDETKGFETVRALRWPDGVRGPTCDSPQITTHGGDETPPARQRSHGPLGRRRVDDVPETIFAGHHQPRRVWILCLYFMGLHRSNHHMAQALDLHQDEVQQMTRQLRQGMVMKKPHPT